MKPRVIVYILLVVFNLISLYFIMVLFSYDEILGYMISGQIKRTDPKELAYLLFVTGLLNLYFLSFILMGNSLKTRYKPYCLFYLLSLFHEIITR